MYRFLQVIITATYPTGTGQILFPINLCKKIGLGFEFCLRNNKQEPLNNALITNANATF